MGKYHKKIKGLLKAKGVNQKSIAVYYGIDEGTFSYNLKRDNLEYIELVCNYLKMPLFEFFAPDNASFSNISSDEMEFIRIFRSIPVAVRSKFIRVCREVAELSSEAIEAFKKKL